MRISQKHTNRRAHNWLIYDIGDHFLLKFSSNFKGVLYGLGVGESPYRDFFLQYADQYIAVDWAGSYHDTKADIAADLNKPLPIETVVADTEVSLSVLEHLCEPQTMLNEAIVFSSRMAQWCCRCLGNGGCMKRPMIFFVIYLTALNTCLRKRALSTWWWSHNPAFLPCGF